MRLRLTKTGKQIIAANDLMSNARDKLVSAGICLPNLDGNFGDVPNSIRCAEEAIKKIQGAIEVMKKIKPA